jgi:hypothetical protein
MVFSSMQDADITLDSDLIEGRSQAASGGVTQHVSVRCSCQNISNQVVQRCDVRLDICFESQLSTCGQDGDAVIAQSARYEHNVARPGHLPADLPVVRYPTHPSSGDEQPIRLTFLDYFRIPGYYLYAGLLGGGLHRFQHLLEHLHREALLQNKASCQV